METRPSGLIATNKNIPLQSVSISGKIDGICAEICVTQQYENRESVPVEAVYVFPLEEGAAVCGFEAKIGGRTVVGQVEERDKGFEQYDDAMADGHGAFLLEQERPNIFTASIGNLKAGQQVTITLRYVALLSRSDVAVRLMLPTTVSPRYLPPQPARVGQPEAERINPPRTGDVPYGLTLSIDVACASPIRVIESPSHTIRCELDGDSAKVSLSQPSAALDQDFVLLIETNETHKPAALVARDERGGSVVMLNFFPDFTEVPSAVSGSEVTFLLDCSGSMHGESIEQARRALGLCVRALNEGDVFNVVCFGSSFRQMWKQSKPYNQDNLDAASAYIRRIQSDMGGTEILSPLKFIMQAGDPSSERQRQILLLTDGQVGNEADVITLCKEYAGKVRVFSFGIGRGVSEHLVRGVARASRGAAEFIHPGERIEPVVLGMLEKLSAPPLDNVTVDWGGLSVEQAPGRTPPIFPGQMLTVFARVEGGSSSSVTLKAGAHEWTAALDMERARAGSSVVTLWAQKRIADLEAGSTSLGSNRGRERREARRNEQLVELGKRYGLLSSATSYVAIERCSDADRTTDQAQLRKIPIALTNGWGAAIAGAPHAPRRRAFMRVGGPMVHPGCAPAPAPAAWPPAMQSLPAPAMPASAMEASAMQDGYGSAPAEKSNDSDEPCHLLMLQRADGSFNMSDELYDLLMLQRADGSFNMSDQLLELIAIDRMSLGAIVSAHDEAAVATALVIAWFKRKMSSRSAEWSAAARKAGRYLKKHAPDLEASALPAVESTMRGAGKTGPSAARSPR